MEILLTQGKVALVDDADGPLVSRYKWYAMQVKPGRWVAAAKVQGKQIYLHRFLTGLPMTDHHDGNPLNNRRENLRRCTNQQNQFNRKKQASSSRFKGVTWDKRSSRWLAQIQHNNRNNFLGYHATEEAAAAAYRTAAVQLFGEFARF